MHKISEKNRRVYEEVVNSLKKLISQKSDTLKPKLVILYGSFVRGDWHQGSDLDVLLISDSVPTNFKDRWDLFYDMVMGFPIEPHIYTTKEFEEMLTHGRMTVLDALTEGETLYADDEYLKKTTETLREVMRRLKPKKTKIGWELKKH